MRNCYVPHRDHVTYRIRNRNHFTCQKANNSGSRIVILWTAYFLIRFHRANKGTNSAIRTLNSTPFNFFRYIHRGNFRITSINIITKFAFRAIRRIINICRDIISISHLIRNANRRLIRTSGRFTYRMFLIGSLHIVFSVYKKNSFTTRLRGNVQSTCHVRVSTANRFFLSNRCISFLTNVVRHRRNNRSRLIIIIMRRFETWLIHCRQRHFLLCRTNTCSNFFRFKYI